ncbi:sulfotransferase family protein [Cognatilysobacter terrigena]|uniref:sulfotransferase family protein n=1 Tax=Cognatilysobacter terrigena TaxID=2488749 RepID=UPI001414D438|nr:sulfotransferase [Lysobacter terrigena]
MQAERHWKRVQEYMAAGNVEAARVALLSLLASQPHDVTAWGALSDIEIRRRRYRLAHGAALEAAAAVVASGDRRHLGYVTFSLLGFDDVHRVRQLITESDWSSDDIARQAPVLAQHLSLVGADEDVLRFCEAVRPRLAPDARLEYMCGLAARNLGRVDDATSYFERAIAIAPSFAPAHWSLAFHQPTGEERLPRIRSALQTAAPKSADAVDLHYALYRECERAGRNHDAWRWLSTGMAMKAATLDPRSWSDSASTVDPVLPPAEGEPCSLIFVVGMPRTGTTVLERILGNHSRVCSAGELNAFHAALCESHDTFLTSPSMTRTSPPDARLEDTGALYRASTRPFANEGRIVLDKNPANFLYAAAIARALPEARILCLRRSPMDACFSNLRELFDGDAYGYSYDVETVASQYAWFDAMRRRFEVALPGRFMTVSYEALVADPAEHAARVLQFCGLDYEDGCERIENNASPVATASASQVREAIHGRGVGAWMRYREALEPLRRALVERGISA